MAKFHWDDCIEERKDVMLGKPTLIERFAALPMFKGTRLTVELVLKALGAGTTQEELLAEFPHLKPEHIRAATPTRMSPAAC